MLKKKQAEVSGVQQQIVDTIHKILGSKPTLSVCVEGVRPIPEDRSVSQFVAVLGLPFV